MIVAVVVVVVVIAVLVIVIVVIIIFVIMIKVYVFLTICIGLILILRCIYNSTTYATFVFLLEIIKRFEVGREVIGFILIIWFFTTNILSRFCLKPIYKINHLIFFGHIW